MTKSGKIFVVVCLVGIGLSGIMVANGHLSPEQLAQKTANDTKVAMEEKANPMTINLDCSAGYFHANPNAGVLDTAMVAQCRGQGKVAALSMDMTLDDFQVGIRTLMLYGEKPVEANDNLRAFAKTKHDAATGNNPIALAFIEAHPKEFAGWKEMNVGEFERAYIGARNPQ